MKQTFIVKENNPKLVLFFAGWGMNEQVFADYRPHGCDLLICYDYRSLSFDADLLASYSMIRVVAWSMGVWVAEKVLPTIGVKKMYSVACNGTPYPIDDERGIALDVFQGTCSGLNDLSLWKFFRRMCGMLTSFREFEQRAPKRAIEELKQELLTINELYNSCVSTTTYAWDKVYVGMADRIFLPANQLRAWGQSTEIVCVDEAHYSEVLLRKLIEEECYG